MCVSFVAKIDLETRINQEYTHGVIKFYREGLFFMRFVRFLLPFLYRRLAIFSNGDEQKKGI